MASMTLEKQTLPHIKKSINSFWYYINKVIKQIRTFILLRIILLSHSNFKQHKEIMGWWSAYIEEAKQGSFLSNN